MEGTLTRGMTVLCHGHSENSGYDASERQRRVLWIEDVDAQKMYTADAFELPFSQNGNACMSAKDDY